MAFDVNLVYDAKTDSFMAPADVSVVAAPPGYTACRQELYDVLAKYSRDDAIAALTKTLGDWKNA